MLFSFRASGAKRRVLWIIGAFSDHRCLEQLAEDLDLELGAEVAVVADDYGVEACRGTVTYLSTERVSLSRRDPDLGEIAVHFPRAGYRITKV